MAYETFEKFRQDFEVAQLGAQAVHGNMSHTKPIEPTVAWKLYGHSRNPSLGFHIFGRHVTGDKAKELQQLRTKKG